VKSAIPSRRSPFWILQLGGWGLFGAGMFVAGLSQWGLLRAAVVKSSLTLFGFGASLLLWLLYRGLRRAGAPLPVLLAAAIPLSFGAAGAWMAAHNLVVATFEAWRKGAHGLSRAGFPDFVNTIYFFFVLLAWSVLYFGAQAYRDLLAERERLRRAEALAHEARLRALRLQLNPHFLFNTLNAVSTLVAEGRSAEANRMLARLSDFLRSTLERTETDEIPLAEEIDFIGQYLEIEEARLGGRLRVEIGVEPGTEIALVPPLILQPLVENAVRHAIQPREGGGAIEVTARRRDRHLVLGVVDDGPGIEAASAEGQGVGLTNTRQRLAELYGERAELLLGSGPRGGLAVSVRLPFRAAAGLPESSDVSAEPDAAPWHAAGARS
jgi:two-component system, LytTR family, sensor kinase